MRIIVPLIAAVVASCSHQISLYERGSSVTGTGTAHSSGSGSGPITVTLNGKVYEGEWVLGSSGTALGFGNTFGTAVSGSQFATFSGSSTMLAVGGSSQGNIIMRTKDGAGLRCLFSYADLYDKGTGICQDDAGKLYDMQIK